MLVLHFSHVWSLGGVASTLEVGREDWGLSGLGRKAGVPPGRRETDRHIRAQGGSSIQAVFVQPTPPFPAQLQGGLASKAHLGADGKVTVGVRRVRGEGSHRARSLAEAGQRQETRSRLS